MSACSVHAEVDSSSWTWFPLSCSQVDARSGFQAERVSQISHAVQKHVAVCMAALGGHSLRTCLVHAVSARSKLLPPTYDSCQDIRHVRHCGSCGRSLLRLSASITRQVISLVRRISPRTRQPYKLVRFADVDNLVSLGSCCWEIVHHLDMLASVVVSPQPPLEPLSHAKESTGYVGHSLFTSRRLLFRPKPIRTISGFF